jgi:hypothetical protein
MPGRKEFEFEFDNEADHLVKEFEFLPEDSPQDTGIYLFIIALKCAVMNIYNTTLERRLARKSFIFDRKITDDYRKVIWHSNKRFKVWKRNALARKKICTKNGECLLGCRLKKTLRPLWEV